MNEIVGKCPICQMQLVEQGGIVSCSSLEQHYQIRLNVWNAAWGKYDSGVMDGTTLLTVLLRGNIAPNKPERNKVRA